MTGVRGAQIRAALNEHLVDSSGIWFAAARELDSLLAALERAERRAVDWKRQAEVNAEAIQNTLERERARAVRAEQERDAPLTLTVYDETGAPVDGLVMEIEAGNDATVFYTAECPLVSKIELRRAAVEAAAGEETR